MFQIESRGEGRTDWTTLAHRATRAAAVEEFNIAMSLLPPDEVRLVQVIAQNVPIEPRSWQEEG